MSNIQSVFLLYLWNRNLCDMTSVHLLLIQLSLMSFITLLLGFFGQSISHEQWINHLLWTGQWITTPSSSQSWLMTSLSSLLLNIHSLIGSISWTTRHSDNPIQSERWWWWLWLNSTSILYFNLENSQMSPISSQSLNGAKWASQIQSTPEGLVARGL